MNSRSVRNRFILGLCLAVVSALTAAASEPSSNDPVGTWLLTISQGAGPSFTELLTFHVGGTLSETNTMVNYLTPPETGFPPGSDGQGIWKKIPRNGVHFKFVKLMFAPAPVPVFLVVEGDGYIDDDTFTGPPVTVELCFGDLANCSLVGTPTASGTRLGF